MWGHNTCRWVSARGLFRCRSRSLCGLDDPNGWQSNHRTMTALSHSRSLSLEDLRVPTSEANTHQCRVPSKYSAKGSFRPQAVIHGRRWRSEFPNSAPRSRSLLARADSPYNSTVSPQPKHTPSRLPNLMTHTHLQRRKSSTNLKQK